MRRGHTEEQLQMNVLFVCCTYKRERERASKALYSASMSLKFHARYMCEDNPWQDREHGANLLSKYVLVLLPKEN